MVHAIAGICQGELPFFSPFSHPPPPLPFDLIGGFLARGTVFDSPFSDREVRNSSDGQRHETMSRVLARYTSHGIPYELQFRRRRRSGRIAFDFFHISLVTRYLCRTEIRFDALDPIGIMLYLLSHIGYRRQEFYSIFVYT